jgi:3-phenylpropionate/trans-cinnamate dioxygenase ferredoxin subunit
MWIPVAHLSEFEGDRKVVEVPGERQPVLLLEVGGMVYAIADVCTHDGNLLSDGELEGFFLRCSRHGRPSSA